MRIEPIGRGGSSVSYNAPVGRKKPISPDVIRKINQSVHKDFTSMLSTPFKEVAVINFSNDAWEILDRQKNK